MAMGASLAQGFNVGKSMAEGTQPRSFMPVINTMSQIIARRRGNQRRGSSRIAFAGDTGSASDRRAQGRQDRHDLEDAREEEKFRYEMDQQNQEEQQAKVDEQQAAQEGRRQEMHESNLAKSEMQSGLVQKAAGRQDKLNARQDAYEQAKQGLMMGNAALVEDALAKMMPEGGGGDQISYSEGEGGAKKVTARPGKQEIPKFMFHPDGYVGVTFPGQKKPVVFKDAEEAFKTVLAPMSPQRYQTAESRPQDAVSERKNIREADYKRKKLQADVHGDAHEAAMAQFEADGYYQPALYDEKKYQTAYDNYVQKATGEPPPRQRAAPGSRGKGGKPKQYSGEEAPQGFPEAKRGPRGGWYVHKDGKWYPILKGQEQPPGQGKPSPETRGAPGSRSPMPGNRTADIESGEMQTSGVGGGGRPKAKKELTPEQQGRVDETGVRRNFDARGKKVSTEDGEGELYRGTAPPPDYPDAQHDRDSGTWYYFDDASEEWKEVRV